MEIARLVVVALLAHRSPSWRLTVGLLAIPTTSLEVVAVPDTVRLVVEARPAEVTKNGALVSVPPMAKEAVVEVGAKTFWGL